VWMWMWVWMCVCVWGGGGIRWRFGCECMQVAFIGQEQADTWV